MHWNEKIRCLVKAEAKLISSTYHNNYTHTPPTHSPTHTDQRVVSHFSQSNFVQRADTLSLCVRMLCSKYVGKSAADRERLAFFLADSTARSAAMVRRFRRNQKESQPPVVIH